MKIAVDSQDYLYVSDDQDDKILKFDGGFNLIIEWGVNGTGDGEFYCPWGIEVDEFDNIHILYNSIE